MSAPARRPPGQLQSFTGPLIPLRCKTFTTWTVESDGIADSQIVSREFVQYRHRCFLGRDLAGLSKLIVARLGVRWRTSPVKDAKRNEVQSPSFGRDAYVRRRRQILGEPKRRNGKAPTERAIDVARTAGPHPDDMGLLGLFHRHTFADDETDAERDSEKDRSADERQRGIAAEGDVESEPEHDRDQSGDQGASQYFRHECPSVLLLACVNDGMRVRLNPVSIDGRTGITSDGMPTSRSVNDGDAWRHGQLSWEIAFAGVLVATSVVIAVTEPLSLVAKTVAVLLLLGQVPAYLLLGRLIVADESRHPLRFAYVLLVAVLFVPATLVAPPSAFALFAIAPLCYMVVHPLAASITVGVLNVGPVATLVSENGSSGQKLVQGAAIILVGALLSFTFGMWIHRIVQQSGERAQLIRDLDATRAELAEVSRHAGALEERRRMARDIHDTLAQGFSSIVMLLQAAEAEPGGDGHYLQLARRAAQSNLDDARALVTGSLHTVPVPESLRRVTERFEAESGVEVYLSIEESTPRLEAPVEIALLRVVQEALANVHKHSGATSVEVNLELTDESARLQLHDNGSGFDVGAEYEGYGLPGIRGRMAEVGGSVDIVSSPTTGTTVTVAVPA